eukprot:403366303
MQIHQTVSLQNFEYSSNNVGKRLNWSKKSYTWSFEAVFNGKPQVSQNSSFTSNRGSIVDQSFGSKTDHCPQKYRIQFMDSLNSGKRTIVVNDVVVLHKAKMNNFGVEPYQIVSSPLDIKIVKYNKKGPMLNKFEVLINDKEFHLLKQLGGSKVISILINNIAYQMTLQSIETTQLKDSEKISEQISPNSSLQTDLSTQSIQQNQRQSQLTNTSNIFSPTTSKDDTFDFNFQSSISEIKRQPSQNMDFDFSGISGVSNNMNLVNQGSPQSQASNSQSQKDNFADNFFRGQSHSVKVTANAPVPKNLDLHFQQSSDSQPSQQPPLARASTQQQMPSTNFSPQQDTNACKIITGNQSPDIGDYFDFSTNTDQPQPVADTFPLQQTQQSAPPTQQNISNHKPPTSQAKSSANLIPFDDFFGITDDQKYSNNAQPTAQRCQSNIDMGDLLCLDDKQPNNTNDLQNQEQQQAKFNPAPYSFITDRLSQIQPGNFFSGQQFQTNMPNCGMPGQMGGQPFGMMPQSPMNNSYYSNNCNTQQQQVPGFMMMPSQVQQFGQMTSIASHQIYQTNYPQPQQQQSMFQAAPNSNSAFNVSNNNKDLQMQHILKEVNGFAQKPQGFDRFERERQMQMQQKQNNDQLSQQLSSLLKFD